MLKKTPLKNPKFSCEICNFNTSNKKDYIRHTNTAKHRKMGFFQQKSTDSTKKTPLEFQCTCGKIYKDRTGLWRHKKLCSEESILSSEDDTAFRLDISNNNEMFKTMMHLIEQNQEFKSLIIEQQQENQLQQQENQRLQKQLIEAVKDTGNTYNNSITNNNQKFNLNFFLNTTCKDAMNMSEFIENMEVNFKDIENIGRYGYVTGMTNMIMSRIKNLDVTKRPMHCTDLKRETIYIKDNNVWEKDDDNKKLHNMVKCIAHKNYAILPAWRDKNPDCLDSDTPKFDFCIKMMTNVLGDSGEGQIKLDNKVIRNIAKHINVDKNTIM
jgi:hypothetical protein